MPENHPSVFQPLQFKDSKSSGFIKLRVTTKVNIPIARCINANLIFQELSVNLQGKSHFELPMPTYGYFSWGMLITDYTHAHTHSNSNTTDASKHRAGDCMALQPLLNSVKWTCGLQRTQLCQYIIFHF
jgi:hypothetical protein